VLGFDEHAEVDDLGKFFEACGANLDARFGSHCADYRESVANDLCVAKNAGGT
jgi:hypothetical protein